MTPSRRRAPARGRLKELLQTARDEGWAQWIRSEADEKAVLKGCFFDVQAGERVCMFFEKFLRHSKGQWAGQPFKPLLWQREDILFPLFGWKQRNGFRRFRVAYIEVPKKNGKSTLCAGIGLYLLTKDDEPGAEVYSAAADIDQASIVYKEAETMAKSSPALAKRLKILPSRKNILYPAMNSFYRVISADAYTKEGYNIHGLLFDELHAQKTRALWDTLRYGGSARRQSLLVSITTAGYDRQSICWEQHEYAEKVLKGVIEDENFFAYIRAAGKEDDWTDPDVWRKANPSMGVTIDETTFAAECREAKASPRKQNAFKRYRLNIWTSAETQFLDSDAWKKCKGDQDLEAMARRRCWAGVDLSSTTDLSACALVFEPDPYGFIDVLVWTWVPGENIDKRARDDGVPYDLWRDQGWLEATEGNVIDHDFIRMKIRDEIKAEFPLLQWVEYDSWNATKWAIDLEGDGVPVKECRQGFKTMSPPTKELEKLVLGGKLRHNGNPVLGWCIDNVMAVSDPAENIKPDKSKSKERIDAAVALIMALKGLLSEADIEESVYETRGIAAI